MKNVLILHGTENNSHGNWFPWLSQELVTQGFNVWCPDLPQADHPDQDRYFRVIFGNSWIFDKDTIVVGHSSGGVTALKVMQHLPENVVINKCITVGASHVRHGQDPIQGLFIEPYDFSVIKKHARHFIIFHSDDDPYVPLKDAEILQKLLGAELKFIPNQGHFNLEKGPQYTKFPELLTTILE